jgi:GH18 family chitinase
MSTFKQIRNKGVHQEDLVELLDSLIKQRASILNYMSALGKVCSAVFGEMSDMTTSLSISLSTGGWGQSFGITARASFPTSFTALTSVTVTLV